MLTYTMAPGATDEEHEDAELIDDLNELIDRGAIRMEINEHGEFGLYPSE